MSLNTQMANGGVNAQAQALIDQLAAGYCRIYDGAQPANGDTPVTTQILLAELRFASPAAAAPSAGVIAFTALGPVNAVAGGTGTWYRCLKSDGVTAIMDGSVGLADANMILSNVVFVNGASVQIAAWEHDVVKSA